MWEIMLEKAPLILASAGQIKKELSTANIVLEALEATVRAIGDAGVTDPQTARELVFHLEAAQAAAHRWKVETIRHDRDLKTDPV